MHSIHRVIRSEAVLFLAAAALALVCAGLAVPQHASAAVVTLSTATTSSNNASTTLAKVGDVISYRLVLSGNPSATTTPVINIWGAGTTTMTASAGTSYVYSTTTTNTSIWANGFVSFYMAWGGSAGEATTTIASTSLTSANVRFDKSAPTISTITSSATAAGALKVDDTITFTLTPGATEYGATVAGSYNGQTLSWSTSNSGATFTATYTVTPGDTDRTSALQISGVIITDAAGNASSAGAGSDIAKTIDANSPSAPTATPGDGTTFSGRIDVSLSASGSDSIRYTSDGTTPTCSTGSAYAGPIAVTSTHTLRAIGCDAAGNSSSVASFSYSMQHRGGGGSSHRATPATPAAPSTPAAQNNNAPASSNSVFTRDLEVGVSGDDVAWLQAWLNAHGFAVALSGPGSAGHETTTFGALTKAAVARFQATHGIPAIGRFGPMTRAAIAAMK